MKPSLIATHLISASDHHPTHPLPHLDGSNTLCLQIQIFVSKMEKV